ncbi:STAS domain-containing protein [Heyndrickxia acidicola]|uniref:STAS domain-containing protein n=1 Tax=Heyndrickxia acidicola TaxID=209389 RepID=A0ABU6MJ87_9BACI|nr:STAS domain-containing protein [Heyndrickxia acidicola]MED1204534.1 STAS domain-containing protein [Heyndrickxia acidicola]
MKNNSELYQFFLDKTWDLTEAWYKSLDKSDPSGVYASTDPDVINATKQQNYAFHKHISEIFIIDEEEFIARLETWILEVTQDEQHLKTPIHFILREFFRTQEQYLDLMDDFANLHTTYTQQEIDSWKRRIITTMDKVMIWFVEENHHFSMKRLQSQQEMIKELSSPIIVIGKKTALLPLIGDIDTSRAKYIIETSLYQCANKSISLLYIDLSGVVMIDTMVAHQLFQLIEALNLIGVKSILSGIRPEIAQTAIQLGLDFSKLTIKSSLQLVKDE